MKNYDVKEMSVNEMEETYAGCGWCVAVDAVCEVIKAIIHK
ncbi:MAG: hypothetical protein ACRCY5_07660 [Phocaeicola sp.]